MIISASGTDGTVRAAFEAAGRGDLGAVKALADLSFHMETCDPEGNSLLHYGVKSGNLELARFLTQVCGLDPAWANKELVTPFDLAAEESARLGRTGEIEAFFRERLGFSREGCYRNPIIRGMAPDPSIVRVGEDYYMVHSSFLYFPGIPISHSKDLVHWRVIGYVMTDPRWAKEHLGPLEGGRGFWAPDISYADGWFYVCATLRLNDDAPCIQLQMVTRSRRPEGPYEEPVLHPVRGIDPSLFLDDDGRRYMLLNRGARLMEVSRDGKELLSKPEMIWYGSLKHGPEGPHILKKDGWYYCFLAEGGTGMGHQVTVARSRSLKGPYEDCPYNPIMTQRHEAGAIQCCGHGKPVDTPDGRWFMVYLCSRFVDGKWGFLGRETCLDAVTWTADGWPLINGGRGPSAMAALPFGGGGPLGAGGFAGAGRGDPERGGTLAAHAPASPDAALPWGGWLSPRTIDPAAAGVEADGSLWLRGDGRDLSHKGCRALLLRHQPDFSFDAAFEMEAESGAAAALGKEGSAGLTLYYDENTYIKFGIGGGFLFAEEFVDRGYARREEKPFFWDGSPVALEIKTRGLRRVFCVNGQPVFCFEQVTSICSEGLKKGKRFTGAMFGVYVHGKDLVRWRQHGSVE